jgi:hypothetical protein
MPPSRGVVDEASIAAVPGVLLLSLLATLPVPKSVAEVEAQLTQADVVAIDNVAKACRGSLRLTLRDHAGVIGRLDGLAREGAPELKRAILTASRCFRPAAFASTYKRLIADADPGIAAYALEVVSNTRDVGLLGLALDYAERTRDSCLTRVDGGAALDACVWAAYTPSTMLDTASLELRERVAVHAGAMLEAAAPKVREVAVESLAATKLAAHASELAALIAKERAKGFAANNDPALIKRFGERLEALKRAK